ncbi:replication protein [Acinetobacter modestus]|uniref:replication protein n=1 Tax=Acinetobacter modestus TaxID=1776740 RepID=UPI0030178DF5
MNKSNLAHKHEPPQAELVQFPRQERQAMSKKEEGYTPLPNFLVDERYIAELPAESVKLLVILNRHIAGHKSTEKPFTTTLAMELAGFKDERTASKHLKTLVDWNLLKVKKSRGKASLYSLNYDNPKSTDFNKAPTQNVGTYDVPTSKVPTLNDGTVPTSHVGGVPTSNVGLIKNPNKETNKENIYVVFEFWKTTFNSHKTVLTEKRKKKIEARLEQGYSVDDIKLAITNCSKSDYHMGKNERGTIYNDIELICREPEKLDRFITMNTQAQSKQTQSVLDNKNVNQAWANQPTHYEPVEPVELEEWMV